MSEQLNEPQVTEELTYLSRTAESYISFLEQLKDRLLKVLREESKNVFLGEEQSPEPELVPLATEIRQIRKTVEQGNYILQECLRRLEL